MKLDSRLRFKEYICFSNSEKIELRVLSLIKKKEKVSVIYYSITDNVIEVDSLKVSAALEKV